MKKTSVIALIMALIFSISTMAFAAYPEKPINGFIQWGAGGSLDSTSRAITPLVEKILGQTIVLQNKPGASGAVAFNYVNKQRADGYSIFYGAESPVLYKVSGLAPFDYDEFEPVCIFMQCLGIVIVPENSPYKTFKDLIEAAKKGANIKIGSTGPGGTPYMVNALINQVHGVKLGMVNFDGEGAAVTALMGDHIDALPTSMMSATQFVKGGKVRALAVISQERFSVFPNVPAVAELYPDYNRWLPWSVFFGAFVRKDTPKEIVKTLSDAYAKAAKNPRYVEFANKMGGIATALTGEDAKKFLESSRTTASWLMYRSGGTKTSPEKFGIKEPK